MAARILVFILNAGRPIGVAFGKGWHAISPYDAGNRVGFGPEGLALVEFSAVTAAADAERSRPLRMPQAEMQRREAAHRQSDDMRLPLADVIEHGEDIVGGAGLRIGGDMLRHVGGGKPRALNAMAR